MFFVAATSGNLYKVSLPPLLIFFYMYDSFLFSDFFSVV